MDWAFNIVLIIATLIVGYFAVTYVPAPPLVPYYTVYVEITDIEMCGFPLDEYARIITEEDRFDLKDVTVIIGTIGYSKTQYNLRIKWLGRSQHKNKTWPAVLTFKGSKLEQVKIYDR